MSPLVTAPCPYAADLLEIIPALVAYVDVTGVYRQMSQAYERWCGIRREDYLGRHYEEILPQLFGTDYLHLAAPRLQQAFHGEMVGFETRILNNQTPRDVKITYTPDRDETGAVRGVLVLVSDISDLKQAEERVKTSEERLRLAADASNMGFWDLDLVTNELTWSPVCYRVLCFDDRRTPPTSEEFFARVHPEDRETRASAFAAAQSAGQPYKSEYRIRRADGSWQWIYSCGHFIFNSTGEAVRALGVVFDITERKSAEQLAIEQSQRIDQILESTTDGVFMLDREWRFTYLNCRAKKFLSGAQELLGANLWDAFPFAETSRFGECYRRTMYERVQTSVEAFYPEPLCRWFEVHAFPSEEGMVGFFRDVTERRESSAALHLQEQAIDAVPVGISIAQYDPPGDFPLVYVNPAFEQITGYPKSEILGRNCRFLQGPGTHESSLAPIRGAIEQGESAKVIVLNYRKDGSEFLNELQVSPVRNQTGEITHIVGIQNDVTDRILAGERLNHQAQYDTLTGIPNRYLFLELLKQAIKLANRKKVRELALVYLGVDNLKHVNERFGHQGGDRILKQIGNRISSAIRESDIAARIGGDEFVLLFTDYADRRQIEKLIERVLKRISAPFRISGRELIVTASAGYAVAPEDAADSEDLLRKADLAMLCAKRECKATWRAYRPAMDSGHTALLDIAAGLRQALKRDEFLLMYQPRIDARTNRLHSLEALIRWQHPERGLIFPAEFIPVAEETGIIIEIGQWVILEALRQIGAWRAQGCSVVPVSVNVSAAQFRNPAFPDFVVNALEDAQVSPDLLEIELTESIFMDEGVSNELLTALRNIGVRIAIDDFGTGYSGLRYLQRFSVDILKIDRVFTKSIGHSSTAASICRSILQLAQELRLIAVAEGVESAQQATLLQQWGCDQLQGYHFGYPVPADATSYLLSSH